MPTSLRVPKNCTGCSACAAVCSKNAIDMKEDVEGFMYPSVDGTLCATCGLCNKICPVQNSVNLNSGIQELVAVIHKDEHVRACSSSGGAFFAIASWIIKHEGTVYGAAMSYDCKSVKHEGVSELPALEKLMGSKYVQSDIRGIYKEIECLLKADHLVLFAGTPCQVGGLKAYLKKDYLNLYTQDIVCHGVPSPLVWRRYVEEIEAEDGSPIEEVNFRNKITGWKRYSLFLKKENEKEVIESVTESPYLKGFISNISLRKGCFNCQFRGVRRQTDFTLADCWGAEHFLSEYNDDKGITAVLVHTEKGKKLLADLDELDKIPLNYYEFLKYNPSLIEQPVKNDKRTDFFSGIKDHHIKEWLVQMNNKVTLLGRIRSKMQRMRQARRN